MKCFIFFSIFSLSICFGDDIYFRNGQVCKKVLVIDTLDNKISVNLSTGERVFPLTTIKAIIKKPYNPKKESIIQNKYSDEELEMEIELSEKEEKARTDSLRAIARLEEEKRKKEEKK